MIEGKLLGGRYQILDKVGSGGMAEVFRGTDTVLGRTVAIKMMLPNMPKIPPLLRALGRRLKLQQPSPALIL